LDAIGREKKEKGDQPGKYEMGKEKKKSKKQRGRAPLLKTRGEVGVLTGCGICAGKGLSRKSQTGPMVHNSWGPSTDRPKRENYLLV